MSAKRPISPRTPNVPNAPSEPSSSSKKAKTNEIKPNGSAVKLTAGAKWVVERLDEMHKHYAEAILAAASMVDYQTHAKSLGVIPTKVPGHMTQRMELAWGKYERTKRLVEWYIARNAEHVSTPSKPPPLPAREPVIKPNLSLLTIPKHLTIPDHPVASPIPLSSASFMINDSIPSTSTVPSIKPIQPVQPTATAPPIPIQQVIDLTTSFDDPVPPNNLFDGIIQPIPIPDIAIQSATAPSTSIAGEMGEMEFSGLDMDELNAMINGQQFDFASMGNAADGENGGVDLVGFLGGMGGTQNAQHSVQPQVQQQQAQSQSVNFGQGLPSAQVDTQGMTEAERILDSLGSLARPDTKDSMARNQGNGPSINLPYQGNQQVQQPPPQDQAQTLQQQQQQLALLQQQHSQRQQQQQRFIAQAQSQPPLQSQSQPQAQLQPQPQQSVDELFASLNAQSSSARPNSSTSAMSVTLPTANNEPNAFALNFDQNTPTGLGLTSGPSAPASMAQAPNQGDVDLSSLVGLFDDQNAGGIQGGNGFDVAGMGGGDGMGIGGKEGIDLDEYNFNDGMIGVDGDEFESLFAEFK